MINFVKTRNGIKVYGESLEVLFNIKRIILYGRIKYHDVQDKYLFYPGYWMLCFEGNDLMEIATYVNCMNKELKK